MQVKPARSIVKEGMCYGKNRRNSLYLNFSDKVYIGNNNILNIILISQKGSGLWQKEV